MMCMKHGDVLTRSRCVILRRCDAKAAKELGDCHGIPLSNGKRSRALRHYSCFVMLWVQRWLWEDFSLFMVRSSEGQTVNTFERTVYAFVLQFECSHGTAWHWGLNGLKWVHAHEAAGPPSQRRDIDIVEPFFVSFLRRSRRNRHEISTWVIPRDKFHCFVNTSTKDWHSDATARTCFEQGKSIPGMVNPKTLMGIDVSLVQAESRMLGFCHILPVAAALAGPTLFHNNGEQFLQWQPGHDRGLPHRAFQVLKWYIVHSEYLRSFK